ncbi:chalcone isomerase family protein [Zoogloea dura]|jgi:hypothetical protein|uniref:Chalcone isomerase domain-containing protein n=1 Tax=Zoogloea dura TaxID=2728840 RepID=A0A848GAQ4_9RHOO|nr:chalcone isomerase family protein [Zoogloea dura]NML28460.1 hypothetical protein [Zoogloea dura]
MPELRRAVLVLLWLFASAASAALPEPVRALAPGWRLLGSGEARFIGLRLYDASLWVSGPEWSDSRPYALVLTYARGFSRSMLVTTSLDEMRRLGSGDEAALLRWKADLERVFPDVAEGETIVGVSLPGRGAAFYHQGRLVGEVADPVFAHTFFAIWLDRRTRVPALRARLFGQPS